MIAGSLGRRYANALLELAKTNDKIENYLTELLRLQDVLKTSADLSFLLTDPAFDGSVRKKVLESVAAKLSFDQSLLNFIKILIDRERMNYFEDVVRSYQEMADEVLGRVRVEVQVAEDLTPSFQEELQKKLTAYTHKQVILEKQINPKLLGGILLKIKDQVLDGSIQTALYRMKEKMKETVI